MTSVFSADGKNVPCTVIEAGPCVVTQVKTVEKDGYKAVQLGFGEAKESRTNKPMTGIFKKAGTTPKKHLAEFKFDEEYNLFKGMRMGGQMGGDRVTTQNLKVLKVIPEQNLLIVKGSFAGCNGSTVLIEK